MRDMVPCPNCFEGKTYTPCCETGCERCGFSGELEHEGCDLCGGTGEISFALRRLHEADKWVRANAPEWHGVSLTRPGITVFGEAEYFRKRGKLGKVKHAFSTVNPVDEMTVVLVGDRSLELSGFAWGYGGEGPNGLAAVLADAMPQLFPTFDDAMRFVAGLEFGKSWTIVGEIQ